MLLTLFNRNRDIIYRKGDQNAGFRKSLLFVIKRIFKNPSKNSFNEIQLILCFYDLLDHNEHTRSKILVNYSLNCVFWKKC